MTLVKCLAGIFLLVQLCVGVFASKVVHYVHWNMSNPIFRIDNTDHIIDVNEGNLPWEYDQANIICPVYKSSQTDTLNHEKYVIYSVTKEEYDSCRITNPNPKVVAVCDKPNKVMYFTITFRSFTPSPGALEFKPGHDYYFISTSSRDDLHRRVGGRCSTHNMKITFKVADNANVSNPEHPPTVNEPRNDDVDYLRRDFFYPENNSLEEKEVKQEASRMQHESAGVAPYSQASGVLTFLCGFVILRLWCQTWLWKNEKSSAPPPKKNQDSYRKELF